MFALVYSKEEADEDVSEKQNELYMWNGWPAEDNLTCYSSLNSLQIVQVACGDVHMLILATDGRVFSTGNGQQGQLGLEKLASVSEPCLVSSLNDRFVIQVACGSFHSACVCDKGEVFCWGGSSSGQCGIESCFVPVPRQVLAVQPSHICRHGVNRKGNVVCAQQVSCGYEHTVILSTQHELWVWGKGPALGLATVQRTLKPRKITFLEGEKVLAISSGAEHCLAIVEKKSNEAEKLSFPVEHLNRLTTCCICDSQYYTMTDLQDTIIINDDHVCPLGFKVTERRSINSKQSVSTEDISVAIDVPGRLHYKSISDEDLSSLREKFSSSGSPFKLTKDKTVNDVQNNEDEEELRKELATINQNDDQTKRVCLPSDTVDIQETGATQSDEHESEVDQELSSSLQCAEMCSCSDSSVHHRWTESVSEPEVFYCQSIEDGSIEETLPQSKTSTPAKTFLDTKAARAFLTRQLSGESYKTLHKTIGAVVNTVPVSQGVNTSVEFVKDNFNYLSSQVKDNVNYFTSQVISSVPRLVKIV